MSILRRAEISLLLVSVLVPLSWSFVLRRLSEGPSVEDDAVKHLHTQRKQLCEEIPPRVLRQVLGSAYNDYYMAIDPPEGTASDHNKRSDNPRNKAITNRPFFVRHDLEDVLSDEPAWRVDFAEAYPPQPEPAGAYRRKKREEPWETEFSEVPSRELPPVGLHHSDKPAWEVDFAEVPSPELHPREKRSPPEFILDAIGMMGDTQFRWHCEAPLKWIDLGRDYFPRYILSVDCNHSGCRGARFKCEPRSFAVKVLRRRQGLCAPWYRPHKDTLQMGSDQMPQSLKELWVWEMRAVSFCCVCQYQ